MVQANLYPQIVYYLSGLFTMKPLIAAAKAMFGTLDATAHETLLHTVAFSLFQGSRQVRTLVALPTVEARINRLQCYLRNGVRFTYGTPWGCATRNSLQSVVVDHGLVQVYLHSYKRANGTRRGKPDFACNNFCGDQYWLFCLYAEYLSIFLNGNRPYVPTNEVMRCHFAKFWGFLVEYANVGGQDVVPPPRWAN